MSNYIGDYTEDYVDLNVKFMQSRSSENASQRSSVFLLSL